MLDTNASVAFMLGDTPTVEVLAHAERLYLNSLVLGADLRRRRALEDFLP